MGKATGDTSLLFDTAVLRGDRGDSVKAPSLWDSSELVTLTQGRLGLTDCEGLGALLPDVQGLLTAPHLCSVPHGVDPAPSPGIPT